MTDLRLLSKLFKDQIGKPYLWGHQNPLLGFDCSGLWVFALRSIGMIPSDRDMTARELYHFLLATPGRSSREEGAAALYGSSIQSITHISYCLDDKWCVEAYGDESCKTISDAMKWRSGHGAYVRLTLIDRRKDLLACFRPLYTTLGEK